MFAAAVAPDLYYVESAAPQHDNPIHPGVQGALGHVMGVGALFCPRNRQDK